MPMRKHVKHLTNTATTISLTPRQQQVLDGVWQGLTNKDMAAMLQISVRTLEVHRTLLMQIFQVHNVAQLIREAHEAGCLQLSNGRPKRTLARREVGLMKLPNALRPR